MAGLLLAALAAEAQEDSEYRFEIGAGAGATTYYGDFNSRFFGNLTGAGAAVFKIVVNPHSAVRIAGMYTKIQGNSDVAPTYYPDLHGRGYEYNSHVGDLSMSYEYNFWPYGTGKEYRGAQRLAPYISLGVGMTGAWSSTNLLDYAAMTTESSNRSVITANVPIGVGVKYRYRDRVNFSLDWQMHFSLHDQLDGVEDAYRIESRGLFKNTDCYSTLMFCVTYSISPKCPTCMKDR